MRRKLATVVACAAVCAACRQEMYDQPRYRGFEPSDFFDDGRSVRHLPPGVIPLEASLETTPEQTGMQNGVFVPSVPLTINAGLVERGRERYNIYCSPCHGLTGYGDGPVARRGFRAPVSLHSARSRALPPGYVFAVMTNGYGAMPSYRNSVPVPDRWAIITYIGALQLSRSASVAEVPPERRSAILPEEPPR